MGGRRGGTEVLQVVLLLLGLGFRLLILRYYQRYAGIIRVKLVGFSQPRGVKVVV